MAVRTDEQTHSAAPPPSRRDAHRFVPPAVIALLLLTYATLAWLAVSRQSPTYDEPLGVTSAVAALWDRDYRVDYEHPPLWKYLAALPNGGPLAQNAPAQRARAELSANPMAKWALTENLLYRSGNDGLSLVDRSRAMMLIISIALGALIATWTWRLAGPVAAVFATAFFSLCPSFLAHGTLVKNDVAVALASLCVVLATWAVGRRATLPRVLLLGLLCGAAVTTKLSAVILGPVVILLLALRAAIGAPWTTFARTRQSRVAKAAAASLVLVVLAVTSFVTVWAVYGFRFRAAPTPDAAPIDTRAIVRMDALRHYFAVDPTRRPTEQELAAWDPGLPARTILWALDHHLLPEAFLAGLLFTGRTAVGDWTYTLGHVTFGAPWYYFPLALLVKTPVATLIAAAAAGVLLVQTARARGWWRDPARKWSILCLTAPPAVFLAFAIASNMGLGIRYLLPAYPFAFVVIGLGARRAWDQRSAAARAIPVLFAVALLAEVAWAFPHYIAFFNAPSGGPRGGFAILGDSNLDWGQDLPLLARWQHGHPDEPLYLAYFGTTPPEAYGINYSPLPATRPGVIAISATKLQGIYDRNDPYKSFRDAQPVEVLGGSIYLFKVDPGVAPGAK